MFINSGPRERHDITTFLTRHELFKMILDVKGSIMECGVFEGDGLLSWAYLSAIYEPYNFHREIVGFDTFAGFPGSTEGKDNSNVRIGDLKSKSYDKLVSMTKEYDENRTLGQIPKVRLVAGDFMETGKQFMKDNPYYIIALAFMDFDLYAPTKEAIKLFLPRMPKGSILVFDEIHNKDWPGETLAMLEELNIRNYSIRQFYFDPNVSYIVL